MTATRNILVLCVAAAGLLSAGCNQTQTIDATGGAPRQASPAAGLVAQARSPIPDVPVPIGFSLDEGKSRNFAAAGARYVDHVYKGGSDRFSVARFYKEQMPVCRWALVTDMFVQGSLILDFEKETERCRVTIQEHGLFNGSKVTVQLWTSGRIESPAGKSGK